ncbi:primosomal protein N' family DNA-binding protein [Kytococcus sp. Marseille-QA3725]
MEDGLLPVPGLQVPRTAPAGVGELAPEHPVARVLVMGTLPHLDRPFDYVVPADLDADAVPGARVTVTLAGRTEDGWITERLAESDHPGQLSPLRSVVSPVPALTPVLHALCGAVAAHYGGSVADVVRLAVPARHATEERAALELPEPTEPERPAAPHPSAAWEGVPAAGALLSRIAAGEHPAAAWVAAPDGGDPGRHWAHGLLDLAVASAASGRGALLLVPDDADVEELLRVAGTRPEEVLRGLTGLTASAGPRARYAHWMRVLLGHERIVVGTRSAAFAPVRQLGVVAWWDDGDESWREPRSPRPHVRQVAALRARIEGAALVCGGPTRTTRVQDWVESGQMADLAPAPGSSRRVARVHVAGEGVDAERDAGARLARIPSVAWSTAKRALEHGPVLVQVPRTGYSGSIRCRECGEAAGCTLCPGRLVLPAADAAPLCGTCGEEPRNWACTHCGGRDWRPGSPGTERTVHDLGRAFPGVRVISSTAADRVDRVGPEPVLVVSTPGVEPRPEEGWAAALVLDGAATLELPAADAEGQALRRWSAGTPAVRPDGPGIVLCGVPAHAGIDAVEAFVRRDPTWYARRALAERREAHLPPSVALVHLMGHRRDVEGAVGELTAALEHTEVVGPVPVGPAALPARWEGLEPDQASQAWVRTGWEHHGVLARRVHDLRAHRSARKAQGQLLMTVDPEDWVAP